MSYCIVNIIYGVPITGKMEDALRRAADNGDVSDDWDEFGFTTLYNASGDNVDGYIGLNISEFTVCDGPLRLHLLETDTTEEQRTAVRQQVEDAPIPDAVRAVMPEVDTYLVFSSS